MLRMVHPPHKGGGSPTESAVSLDVSALAPSLPLVGRGDRPVGRWVGWGLGWAQARDK